jgi:hypothetical protein
VSRYELLNCGKGNMAKILLHIAVAFSANGGFYRALDLNRLHLDKLTHTLAKWQNKRSHIPKLAKE